MVLFGQIGGIREKVEVFEKKDFFVWAKLVVFGQQWLYSGKLDVFGQGWLYSGKSNCIRAKVVVFGKLVVFG